MPQIEWQGKVRITIGALSRAAKLDLFRDYRASKWYDSGESGDSNIDYFEQVVATDAMVAAAATRLVEVCVDGKWQTVGSDPVTVTHDGEGFTLSLPITHEMVNGCPADLGDQWVQAGVERNGGLTTNMTFFTSLRTIGKTNSEPSSDK